MTFRVGDIVTRKTGRFRGMEFRVTGIRLNPNSVFMIAQNAVEAKYNGLRGWWPFYDVELMYTQTPFQQSVQKYIQENLPRD